MGDAPRQTAERRKERAALVSIAVSALLTLAKLVAGIATGSLALLSEAIHNLVDTGITVVSFFAIRLAHKPADEEHPYGHGKAEALAALLETGVLFTLAIFIVSEAVRRIADHADAVAPNLYAYAVLVVSIVVDTIRWQTLRRLAKETKSEVLAADALHFSSDIIGSILALGGLLAAASNHPQGDAVAAILVALFIAIAGYRLARRTVDALLDTAPQGLADPIRSAAGAVPGVLSVDALRLRPSGSAVQGEMNISVSRTLPLETVAAIREKVAGVIAKAYPGVALSVSAGPKALDDETVLEQVLLIAAKRHVPVHHITVQEIDGRSSVSFDIELDGRMSHGTAHDIASTLEAEVRHELGPEIEVETHIEPLEARELSGRNAPEVTRVAVAMGLERHSAACEGLYDVHNVRVRETAAGLVVNYHCRVPPALSVVAVHEKVDRLDRRMRAEFPDIARIVGHAEPGAGA